MLEFLKKIDMQERKLDRVLDRLQRRFLAADFVPGQLGHTVEIILVRFGAREHLQRHAIV